MDVATAFAWTVERYPSRRAVGGPDPLTYAQWDERATRLAGALSALGLRRGDRVALSMAGGEPQASLHLAAQKLGAVSVPLSTRFGPKELTYCLEDASPALVVTDPSTVERTGPAADAVKTRPLPVRAVEELRDLARQAPEVTEAPPREHDLSVVLYTSGTTGRPKGVPRTHRAEHAAAVAHLLQTGTRPGEATLGVMPMFHTMGLRTLLSSVVSAGTWVPQASFDAEESLALIRDEQITSLYLVPTIYWSLLKADSEVLRGVRRLAYAGAAMTPALAEELVERVAPEWFVNHFGSTEIYTFTVGPDVAAKPGCAGRAGVFSRARLVDPDPQASPQDVVGDREQGQVVVSMASPEAFGGYWRRPDADAAAIRGGWYFTGDLAVADEDGDLWVAGRVDDMIKSGGENVYPDEIEAALVRCPAVDDVVVVGLPDDRWGQAVTAFVVPAPGRAPDDAVHAVDQWARSDSGLPSLKRPKRVVAVGSVPRSAVGKTLRRTLTEGEYKPLAETGDIR